MTTFRSLTRVGAGVAALAAVAATTNAVSARSSYPTVRHVPTGISVNTEYAAVAPDAAVITLTLTDKTVKGLPKVLAPGWHTFVLKDSTKDGRDVDFIKVKATAKSYGVKQFKADIAKANSDNGATAAQGVSDVIKHAQAEGGIAAPKYYAGTHRKLMVNLTAGRTYLLDNTSDGNGPENVSLCKVSGAATKVKAPKATGTIATYEYGFRTVHLQSGTHLVRFTSTGAEAHIIFAAKVPQGTTTEDLQKALSDPNAQGFPPGWTPWLTVNPMTHAGSFVAPVTFAPGSYALICFMPELKAGPNQGAPHFTEGMSTVITVS
ncbi:MAG TPA: hypothetical protein VHE83_15580 [Mycobacteriales bacterium]|nr:hypothetical protein [Mycobacteriales bacterium]